MNEIRELWAPGSIGLIRNLIPQRDACRKFPLTLHKSNLEVSNIMNRWRTFDEKTGVQRETRVHRPFFSITICDAFNFGLSYFMIKSEYQSVGKLVQIDGGSEVNLRMTPRELFQPIRDNISIHDWLKVESSDLFSECDADRMRSLLGVKN